MADNLTPRKKAIGYVCSVCDLPWDVHETGDDGKVTVTECVRLLQAKAELPATAAPTVWPYYPWTVTNNYYRCSCGQLITSGQAHQCIYPYTYGTLTTTQTAANTSGYMATSNVTPIRRDGDDGCAAIGVPA